MTTTEASEPADKKKRAAEKTEDKPKAGETAEKTRDAAESVQPSPTQSAIYLGWRTLSPTPPKNGMAFILDIPLEITVELGRTRMVINDLLKLGQGSVIELSKLAGETLDILANQRLIARGEVVVVDEKYGIRLTEVISPIERVEKLR